MVASDPDELLDGRSAGLDGLWSGRSAGFDELDALACSQKPAQEHHSRGELVFLPLYAEFVCPDVPSLFPKEL